MEYPENLLYTRRHLWCRQEENGHVTLGVTGHFAEQLEGLIAVTLPDAGDDILNDVSFGEFETTQGIRHAYAPVDGKAVTRNDTVMYDPEIVIAHPYGEGWLIVLEPMEQLPEGVLLTAGEYQLHLQLTA